MQALMHNVLKGAIVSNSQIQSKTQDRESPYQQDGRRPKKLLTLGLSAFHQAFEILHFSHMVIPQLQIFWEIVDIKRVENQCQCLENHQCSEMFAYTFSTPQTKL